MKINRLLLITGNVGKAKEFEGLLHGGGLSFDNKSLDLVEIQSMSIDEIGEFKTRKALEYKDAIKDYDVVMTDDTALYCDGLNQLPGPLIKWFLDTINAKGIYDLVKDKPKRAVACCLLTLGFPKTDEIIQFKGEVEGELVPERGKTGFGWDGIFRPVGYEKTYAELDLEEKNTISHRAMAMNRFNEWLTGS